jgi:hypothetical protein
MNFRDEEEVAAVQAALRHSWGVSEIKSVPLILSVTVIT